MGVEWQERRASYEGGTLSLTILLTLSVFINHRGTESTEPKFQSSLCALCASVVLTKGIVERGRLRTAAPIFETSSWFDPRSRGDFAARE